MTTPTLTSFAAPGGEQASLGAARREAGRPPRSLRSFPPDGEEASLGAARREALRPPRSLRSLPPEGEQASLGAARREARPHAEPRSRRPGGAGAERQHGDGRREQ